MRKILVLTAGAVLVAGSAMAVPFSFGTSTDNPPTSLQQVLDGITSGGVSSVDTTTDSIADEYDSYWVTTDSNNTSATIVVEIAGARNTTTFGIYDAADTSNWVQVFAGADDNIGFDARSTINFVDVGDGKVSIGIDGVDTGVDFASLAFGFYLDSSAYAGSGAGRFYSDTDLNNDGMDHMLAYNGVGDSVRLASSSSFTTWSAQGWILAWEDLASQYADRDYQDFVVMVESVNPVPEPTTMLLLGSGLLGLAGVSRRKSRKS